MANGSLVAEDLVVVAALERLVSEEMDVLVGDSVGLLGLVLEVVQAVGLVPAGGEDVEGDLAADGEAACMFVSGAQIDEVKMVEKTYVRPRLPNFSLRTATNFSRTLASLS